jgi:HEAT repeat protein
VNTLQQTDNEALPHTLVTLLNDENHSTRALAARFLAELLNVEQLVDALNAYVDQPQYYYNVVVAIDRALYCRLPSHE